MRNISIIRLKRMVAKNGARSFFNLGKSCTITDAPGKAGKT
jgi:hypothetical protein